jgi:rRNA maturation RNase YbeY|tara:strand:- start:372 stop:812 length:441 start_codon:yes stop_codon:yes gene_type:complete
VISIQVESDPALDGPQESKVSSIIKHILESEGVRNGKITLIFGSDELLSDLKKKYFNKNHLTDVIAFRLNENDESDLEGEIYISLPRSVENAVKFNEPLNRELGRLLVHGGLHLMGYEDESKNDKKAMTEKENKYLDQIDWKSLYD